MNENLLIELERFLRLNDLDLIADDINFITSIGWKTKITLECKKCHHVFEITVKQLLRPHPERKGLICPRCESERLFKLKLDELYGVNPYTFLTEFTGYYEPLTVQCNDCGSQWKVSAARNLLMNSTIPEGTHPCKKCANLRNFKKNITDLEDTLKEKFGQCNYEFLSPDEFSGIYSKKTIPVKCKICGYTFNVNPQNLLYPRNGKHYCKKCNKLKRLNKKS